MRIANIVLNEFVNDSRVLNTSKSLLKFGHDVSVVALWDTGLLENEVYQDVRVNRIKLLTKAWPKVKLIQLCKYFEFLLKAFIKYRSVEIVHCNDLSALPIGVMIKLFGRAKKLVYDCHEYETEVNGLKGLEKISRKWIERALIPHADVVITVSQSIASEYSRLYEIPAPYLIFNCPPYQDAAKCDLFRESLGIRADQTIFIYQGLLSKGRGIELLLDTFSSLESDANVLVCMGYGPLESLIQEHANRQKTVFFQTAVSPDVLLKFTSSADFGVSLIEDCSLSDRYCLPNKLFEYLMAGLPVLTSGLPEMKRMVEFERVGVVAEKHTVDGLKQALQLALQHNYAALQNRVIDVKKKYSWEEQEKVLLEAYHSLIDV